MEQDMQPSENSTETKLDSKDKSTISRPKKKINKKIILLIIIILVIVGSGVVYFLLLNKGDNNELPVEENVEVLEDKEMKMEENKIDKEIDSDQDGLPDHIEKILKTDLNKADTDGDSYNDFDEIKNGYDPLTNEKYTEEEWGVVKENIKREDKKLYKEMFGDFGEIVQISNCDVFPNKLDLCEPFSCEFKHLFVNEMMERKIVGLIDGRCQYIEEMPNNGEMNCKYPEGLRKAVAQYHRDLALAESIGTSVEAYLGSKNVKTTYTIDGKEVKNPLQEAIDNGQCVISGYNNSKTNYNIGVDIKFPKNIYEFDEVLDGEYYLEYKGEPFKGILATNLSKEGFMEESFTGMTKTTIEAQHKTIVKKIVFAKKAIECTGMYTYTFSVYDCASIDDALDTQDCGGSWNSELQETIENKVDPIATSSEVISVICKDGKESCDPVNYAWACDDFINECKKGYL